MCLFITTFILRQALLRSLFLMHDEILMRRRGAARLSLPCRHQPKEDLTNKDPISGRCAY